MTRVNLLSKVFGDIVGDICSKCAGYLSFKEFTPLPQKSTSKSRDFASASQGTCAPSKDRDLICRQQHNHYKQQLVSVPFPIINVKKLTSLKLVLTTTKPDDCKHCEY